MDVGWEMPLAMELERPSAQGLERQPPLESRMPWARQWEILLAIGLGRPSTRGLGKQPMLLETLGVRQADRLRISFDMDSMVPTTPGRGYLAATVLG